MTKLKRVIEAILFAADGPLTVETIRFGIPDLEEDEIRSEIEELRDAYEVEGRGYRLTEIAGGWQIVSHPDLFPYVERFLEGKRKARLSRAALEALAVVAYRQPITRGEIETMRGVDCGGVLHTLLERDLITVRGRSTALGRPLIYGTTDSFLEHFGMSSLGALPKLEEIESLMTSEAVREQLEAEADRRMDRLGMAPMASKTGDNGGSAARKTSDPGGAADENMPREESLAADEEADPLCGALPER